ncbi:MAG TPA: SRPBCC family protein [Myxococcaceae bacterium]|nr:SRPBCC family protein [Myxococcaceae bacterium]
MARVSGEVTSSTPAEVVLGALTDFGPRRPELWPNLSAKFYQVHSVGQTEADVTEGTDVLGGVWERTHYDWSEPGVVLIEVEDSNTFAPGSWWRYQVEAVGSGSKVRFQFDRRPKNLKGRIVSFLLALGGRRTFTRSLEETLRRLGAPAAVTAG